MTDKTGQPGEEAAGRPGQDTGERQPVILSDGAGAFYGMPFLMALARSVETVAPGLVWEYGYHAMPGTPAFTAIP